MEPVVISLFRFPTSCSWMYKCVSLIAAFSHRFSVRGHGLVWMCGGIVAHTRSSGMCLAESERTNQSAFMFFFRCDWQLWHRQAASSTTRERALANRAAFRWNLGGGGCGRGGGSSVNCIYLNCEPPSRGPFLLQGWHFFWVSLAYHMTRTDFTHLLTVGLTLLSM